MRQMGQMRQMGGREALVTWLQVVVVRSQAVFERAQPDRGRCDEDDGRSQRYG